MYLQKAKQLFLTTLKNHNKIDVFMNIKARMYIQRKYIIAQCIFIQSKTLKFPVPIALEYVSIELHSSLHFL